MMRSDSKITQLAGWCIGLILLPHIMWAQAVSHEAHHAPSHSTEREPGWETILSGVAYFPVNADIREEEGTPLGTEFHLTYWFTHSWALGVGYTRVFGHEGGRNELALIASLKPYPWITFNAGPNFSIPNRSHHQEAAMSAYLESEFNIFLSPGFHLGPVIGGLVGEHSELFGGLHLGYEF